MTSFIKYHGCENYYKDEEIDFIKFHFLQSNIIVLCKIAPGFL